MCEVTYSQSLAALIHRLKSWSENWLGVTDALYRDSGILREYFRVRPWVFIPESLVRTFVEKYRALGAQVEPVPLVTTLEMTVPWKNKMDDRNGEEAKPDSIPPDMQK